MPPYFRLGEPFGEIARYVPDAIYGLLNRVRYPVPETERLTFQLFYYCPWVLLHVHRHEGILV